MTFLFSVYVIGALAMLIAGIVEQRRNLHSIPTRVVINGIRGKSSITRLCAGALTGGGLVTVAKTTGTAARFIPPSGVEEPIYRKFGLANIVEQIGIVRRAAAFRPDALVIECMAVLPDLQEINERKLIHSTICVTAEQKYVHVLREEAARRNTTLIEVDPESVSDDVIRQFPFITFKDNVATSLAVAEMCGVNPDDALHGMMTSTPDPGTVTVDRYETKGRELLFANLFAANDPESTLMNTDLLLSRGLIQRPLTVLVNCRKDRIERSGQMGEIMGRLDAAKIILIGENTRAARVTVPPSHADRVVELGAKLAFDAILDELVTDENGTASLVAVGNIHGGGEELLHELRTLPAAQIGVR